MDYGFCNEFQQTQWLKRDLYHRSVGQKSASIAFNWSLFSRYCKMNIKVSADRGFFLEAQEMNLLPAHWVGWLNSAICDSINEVLISLLVVSNRFLSASRGGPYALAGVPFIFQSINGELNASHTLQLSIFLFLYLTHTSQRDFFPLRAQVGRLVPLFWIIQNNFQVWSLNSVNEVFHRSV